MADTETRPIAFSDLGCEPFRVFFPLAVLAGITGVSLWPLHYSGLAELYPGLAHARIMAYGLFGGFIFGFLGTALPRLLSARPLGTLNVLILVSLHVLMVGSFAMGKVGWGDHLFLGLLLVFLALMGRRFMRREDTPPPGFVLVALAFLCVSIGAVIAVVEHHQDEMDGFWVLLQRLLSYQGFVLLPILGVGPFLLPRFFGLPSAHEFPEMQRPDARWIRKGALALAVGAVIVASFPLEVYGWHRGAPAIRLSAVLVYLLVEFPFRRPSKKSDALGVWLQVAFGLLTVGLLGVALFPAYRVPLLHLTLMGGFAMITLLVATRVVYGHGGDVEMLKGRNRWLWVAVGLMLMAMVTRISGDFWPAIMVSHYVYGALAWIAGVIVWAWHVLPKTLRIEATE